MWKSAILQANRLVRENGQLGLIAACAAGGEYQSKAYLWNLNYN